MRWLWNQYRRWRLRDRGLFNFWDGRRWRFIDVWHVYRQLMNDARLDPDRHFPLVERGEEPETSEYLALITEIFGLHRWDGRRGLTDGEVRNVSEAFFAVCLAVKKNGSDGSISSPPTGSESSASPEPPDQPANSSPRSDCPPSESDDAGPGMACLRSEMA